jgi:hypothetical protein
MTGTPQAETVSCFGQSWDVGSAVDDGGAALLIRKLLNPSSGKGCTVKSKAAGRRTGQRKGNLKNSVSIVSLLTYLDH